MIIITSSKTLLWKFRKIHYFDFDWIPFLQPIFAAHGQLRCALNPTKDQCATQFIQMRECNRPGGPKLVAGETLSIATGKNALFKEGPTQLSR